MFSVLQTVLVRTDRVTRLREESHPSSFHRPLKKFCFVLNKGKNKIGSFHLGSFGISLVHSKFSLKQGKPKPKEL